MSFDGNPYFDLSAGRTAGLRSGFGTRHVATVRESPEFPAVPEWHGDAACSDAPDPDIFFSPRQRDMAAARTICAACPVRAECAEAGRHEEYGSWGGERYKNVSSETRREERRVVTKETKADRLAVVLELKEKGLGVTEIGRRMGITHSSVTYLLKSAA